MDGFIIHEKLGDGSYSTVYKCTRKSDNLPYAMKQVKIMGLSDREKEAAINEVRILASIESPFIAGYKEAFFD
jgi:NIMA (never in mitosis gene a)-related kinase 1/4/5